MNRRLFLFLALLAPLMATAADFPSFASDAEADQWLRQHSPYYEKMAGEVDQRGGYKIRTSKECAKGLVSIQDGQRFIDLNPSLTGPERVSILIFELTNAFQEPAHQEVDARA